MLLTPTYMTLPNIDPILVHLGPVAIHWYALAYVAGIVLGWYYAGRMLRNASLWAPRQPPITPEQLDDFIIWMTGGIILGGRIGYIIAYDASIIWKDPLEVFMIQHGGMSFHGGFVGVVIAALLYAKSNKFTAKRMLNLGDLLACAAPIGLFFGRIANFVNGELWGRVTHVPWAMVFCNKYTPVDPNTSQCVAGLLPRHPSQLYEAFGEGILLFAVLYVLSRRYQKLAKPGLVMGVFIAGYGVIRILVETVRNPDAQMLPFFQKYLTMGMLLSLPMVFFGGLLIWNAWLAAEEDAPPAVVAEPEPEAILPDETMAEAPAPDDLTDDKTGTML